MKVAPCRPNCWLYSLLSKWAFTYFIGASNSCFISLQATTISRHQVCIRHVCKNTLRYQKVINSWNLLRDGRFIGDTVYIWLHITVSILCDAMTHRSLTDALKYARTYLSMRIESIRVFSTAFSVTLRVHAYLWFSPIQILKRSIRLAESNVINFVGHDKNVVKHCYDSMFESVLWIQIRMWNVALPSFVFGSFFFMLDLRAYWIFLVLNLQVNIRVEKKP